MHGTIDLLSLPVTGIGAYKRPSGIQLVEPWGTLTGEPLDLPSGWYRLEVSGSALCLQLYASATYQLIELSAEPGSPAYVRLQAGQYMPTFFAGARPGNYGMTEARLSVLNILDRLRLFGRRFKQALDAGVSPARLLKKVRQALFPTATFGIRAKASTDTLGVLTQQDMARPFVAQDVTGPTFLVMGGGSLDDQNYPNVTFDPNELHDFVVTVAPEDTLIPDALSQIAAHLRLNPATEVLVCDKWINGRPTTHVAFDPLLYASGYPTPHVVKKGHVAKMHWHDQKDYHSVLSVPLATCREPLRLPNAVVPAVTGPAVSIIIPTRDRADLMLACLNGLFDSTPWPHEVIVIDNGSVEPETQQLFDRFTSRGLRVIRDDGPFNFSGLCNRGAAAARHDYLVFLNNDVVLSRADWLAQMMHHAVKPDVGAVGAKLYYRDKRLQHGGVMLGLTQLCGHLWRGMAYDNQLAEPRLKVDSLRAAVTAALLCIDRQKFNAVGGFDEIAFPVTLNDVDLCLKLTSRGWYSVFASQAEAFHLEGETRGLDEDAEKTRRRLSELGSFQQRWGAFVRSDPWLPKAIMRSTETFGFK